MVITSVSACIQADPEQIGKVMLMPGDPLRAKFIAENYLDNAVCFNTVRNMLGYTGTYKGKKISVMGSGMGVPSANLYAWELYNQFGVESIIRVGSTGALADDIHPRDLVIAMAASTNSAYADQYDFPGRLSMTADWELLEKAVEVTKKEGLSFKVGSCFSTDTFINAVPDANKKFRDMGMLCVDMETAGLYALAMHEHKKALSILTVSDHIFTGEFLPPEDIRESFTDMMKIALETARDFA